MNDQHYTRHAAHALILRRIKLFHTLVWAAFAGAILAIPVLACYESFTGALFLGAFVAVECVILALNRMRCPLTGVAARYTDDRRANFDIFLPRWLAQHNKLIFGSLYLAGIVFAFLKWVR
jgi:hypothetical protein